MSLHLTQQAYIGQLFCTKDCVSTGKYIKVGKTE